MTSSRLIWCTAETRISQEGDLGSAMLDGYEYKHSLPSCCSNPAFRSRFKILKCERSDFLKLLFQAATFWAHPNTDILVPACVGHRRCCRLCCRPVQRVKQVNLTYNEAAFSVTFTFYLLLVLLVSCCCAWPSAATEREVSEQILNQGLVQDLSLFFCPKPAQILELPVKMLNSSHKGTLTNPNQFKKIQRNVVSIRMYWIITLYLISSCPPFCGKRQQLCTLQLLTGKN